MERIENAMEKVLYPAVVGTVTEVSNDYFATRYWTRKKVTITGFCYSLLGSEKSNDYFASHYWALK